MWVIIPFLNNWPQTKQACQDVLAQDIEVRILLINQNASLEDRSSARAFESENADRVWLWNHYPTLPSLAATWNAAMDFAFSESNQDVVACLNNDIRLKPHTLRTLMERLKEDDALFVSAVGVREDDFNKDPSELQLAGKGGPDFSCYVASREFHNKYRFDENHTPAYLEDLDMHRRVMLAGEGARIFSINVPYLHYASGSLKSMTPERRAITEKAISEGSRAYYAKKWGGGANEERLLEPFGQIPLGQDICTSTSAMFNHGCRGRH